MAAAKTLGSLPKEKWINGSSALTALQLPLFALVAATLPLRAWGPFVYLPAGLISAVTTLRDALSPKRFAAKNKRYTWLTGQRPTLWQAFCLDMGRRATEAWTHLLTLKCLCPWASLPQITVVGEEHLKAALALGKGAIIWDSTFTQNSLTTKMGLYQAGYRLLHLSRPEHGLKSRFARRYLNPIKIAGECKYLGERVVIEDNQAGPAMRRLAAGLRNNEVVSITVINQARKVVRAKCLAGEINLALGPANLAIREGAALLPVFTLRTGLDKVTITIDPPLPLGHDVTDLDTIRAAYQVYGQSLGRHLQDHPDQWQGWLSVCKPGSQE